jgi:dCMP deaminase
MDKKEWEGNVKSNFKKGWTQKFIDMIRVVKSWSKDPSTKVGALIVGDQHQILSTGYNGFPRGVDDEVVSRYERPDKYKWTEHAERNAIYNYCRQFLKGTTIYLEWYPCSDCARAIIQCGISAIYCSSPNFDDERWGKDFRISNVMFQEAGIEQYYIDSFLKGDNRGCCSEEKDSV